MIGRVVGSLPFSANHITLFSFIICIPSIFFIWCEYYFTAAIIIAFSCFLDAVDGSVARYRGESSGFGDYLDAMVDRGREIIVYAGLATGGYAPEAFFAFSGSFLLSYAKPRTALVIPIDDHDWPAIGDLFDRILTLIIGLIVASFHPQTRGIPTLSIFLVLVAVLTYIGAFQRMLYAKKLIEKSEDPPPDMQAGR